jgi:hypothetical protein
MNKYLPALSQTEIRTTRDTKLVHRFPPIPHTTTTFRDRDQLVSYSLSETAVSPLIRGINDPSDGRPPPLSLHQRNRDLHGSTTTGNTLLLTDLDQRGDRVHDQREVEDGVQRKLRARRTREEGALRVRLWRRGGSKVVKNEGHVLDKTRLAPAIAKFQATYTHLLGLTQLPIPHKQFRKLLQQRIISLAEILRLGETLGSRKLQAGVQLRDFLVHLVDHIGDNGRRRIGQILAL